MASVHDFFLTGDHEAAKAQVASALQAEGFAITPTPKGGLLAKRGSMPITLLLGAMAGKNFQVTFTVEYLVDDSGQLVARLSRDIAAGALKGGAIGANMTNNKFVDTAAALSTALGGTGILASSKSN